MAEAYFFAEKCRCRGAWETGESWMKKLLPLVLACLLLTGCSRGNPLPDGMEEQSVITAGIEIVKMAGEGEYEEIWSRFREDVRESLTVEQIRDLVEDAAADCGDYIQVEDSMATGQESDGESYGVAVIYALYSDGNLLYRVAFDPSMTLIGLSVSET